MFKFTDEQHSKRNKIEKKKKNPTDGEVLEM